jgi:hypothetical protein
MVRPLPPSVHTTEVIFRYETDIELRVHGNRTPAPLSDIIRHAPSLRNIYLSSDRSDALACLPSCPSLRTLRFNHSQCQPHHLSHHPVASGMYVPNLRHLVLHTPLPEQLLYLLSTIGRSIRVLELAFAPQQVFSSQQMRRIFCRCPALEELSFYLGAPEISPLQPFTHPSLRRVRLKISPDEWLASRHVLLHQFAVLQGPSFPELQEVVLHDLTRWLPRRQTGVALLRGMVRRGCRVIYEDGEIVGLGV